MVRVRVLTLLIVQVLFIITYIMMCWVQVQALALEGILVKIYFCHFFTYNQSVKIIKGMVV